MNRSEIDYIKKLLSKRYENIEYLEGIDKRTTRYAEKDIIIFQYKNAVNEECVLKFYYKDDKNESIEHILNEYRLIKSLSKSNNVVSVYEVSELKNNNKLIGYYVTMEKFQETLQDLILSRKIFDESEVVDFMQQMNNVLQLAHYGIEFPLIHSDIKPSNIGIRYLNNGQFEYILMDFDVSVNTVNPLKSENTLSNKGIVKGVTLAYAPPEQVIAYVNKSGDISNRVDIYAVGAIAQEMLTGVSPRKSESSISYELPTHLVNYKWKRVFDKTNNPDPKKRVRTINDALSELHTRRSKTLKYSIIGLVVSINIAAIYFATQFYISNRNINETNTNPIAIQDSDFETQQNKPTQIIDGKEQSIATSSNSGIRNATENSSKISQPETNIKSSSEMVKDNKATSISTSSKGIRETEIKQTMPRSEQQKRTETQREPNSNTNTISSSNTTRITSGSSINNNSLYIQSKWGGPGGNNQWTRFNLGSNLVPTQPNDNSLNSSGLYYQFNTSIGISRDNSIQNWKQITGNQNWSSENDPCKVLIGPGWRIPTSTEWENFTRASNSNGGAGRGTASDVYNSSLKLHLAGFLNSESGKISQLGSAGLFWTSTQATENTAYAFVVGSRNAVVREVPKSSALNIRCIQN